MKKRVNWIWRLVAVAVLLCSLLATAVSVGVAEAATPPTTYLDPIPQYLNDVTYPVVLANVTGTARATTGFGIDTVQIQIKFTWNGTSYYWTGTGWSGVVSYIVASAAALEVTASPWTPQYDFDKSSELPTIGDLTNGVTYTISAYALDTNLEKDTIGSSKSFTYDTTAPLASTINAIGNTTTWVASSISSISGTCNDTTPGKVGQEFVMIWKDSTLNGYYDSGEYWWDGMMWDSDPAMSFIIPTASLGSTSKTWSLSTTSIPWTHNQSYGVLVYSVDWAGNVESSPVSHNFTFRSTLTPTTSAPAIRLDDLPSYFNGSDAATMPSITGSAKAYTNKTIQMVGISIRDISNFMWWNATLNDWTVYDDTTWNPAVTVLGAYDTDLQIDWAFDASAVTWTDGHTYEIKARAVQSDDQKKISDTKSMTCDETAPVATINAFVVATGLGDAVFDSLTSFSGTGADTTGGTAAGQIASVKLLIVGEHGFWSGTSWSSIPQFIDASGTGTWTMSTSLVPWAHMHNYMVYAYAFDKAENTPLPPTMAPFLFIRNLANPVATPTPTPTATAAATIDTTIGSIADYVTALASINGTANASTGVTSVQVKINNSDGFYWTGSAWSTTAIWINATASNGAFDSTAENWVINASTTPALPTFANGSTYYVWASAVSGSLNDSTPAIEHFTIGTAPTATPTATPAPATQTPTTTPAPTATPTPAMTGSGTIGTTGGTLTTSDGKVSVEFPSGTFSTNTEVTIRPSTCHASDDTFTVVSGTCFTITATNTLSKDATICVKASNSDTSKLTLGYYLDGKWHEASDVKYTNGKVCGNIGHFSDWAVLVREKSEGWAWYYWVLIGIGGVIVLLAIVLLVVLPKRRDQGDVPPGSLVDDQF